MSLDAQRIAHEDVALRTALARAHLPVDDLAQPGQSFFAFSDAAVRIGYGGFLLDGPDALLRSIVVDVSRRRAGAGAALLASLLAQAEETGARRAWLLTTDAEAFFAKNGFARTAHDDAPDIVRASPQFRGLCPASAAFMRRDLGS